MSGDPLIQPDDLAELLRTDEPVVVDVRWRLTGPSGRTDYANGHIPGAVFLDLDTDLCGPPGRRGRHPLPDPRHLEAVLRRIGLNDGDTVVVYDGGDAMAASRAWWTLRWAGLDDVRVLDGGYPAWQAAGYPTTTTPAVPDVGDIVVRPGGMRVVDADGARRLAEQGRLVDVRAPERYRGDVEPIDKVAGHIPGAINGPNLELDDDGRFRDRVQLRQRYADLGLPADQPVGAYCGSGVTAARTVLGMTLAGYRPVLYVGSWSEWITDPRREIRTGPTP